MPYVKNNTYVDIPFYSDTPYNDFYIYSSIEDLAVKSELHKEEIIKCRTIGILRSLNGRFFLNDIDSNSGHETKSTVQVSVVYLRSPPKSTVIPYPVQVFGTLQWKNRPTIFANMLQVLSVPIAIRLKRALSGVTTHLARNVPENDDTL